MHERAGDRVLKPGKARRIGKQALAVSSSDSAPPRSPPPPSYQPSIVNHNTVPTEQIPEAAVVPNKIGTSMTRRFTVREKLQIIDKYKELENISETCRQVMKKFRRSTFARKSLSSMLLREQDLRKASGTKKIRKTVRPRTGEFPKMDKALARQVRETRRLGIPVESYMLEIEGERIMKDLYPKSFDSSGKCKLGFTCGQKRNWMQRERFSHLQTTTKKRKNLSSEESIAAISKFQLDTRVFQLTVPDLKLVHVYNRDQVPMALASSYSSTIDDTNKDVI